MTPQKFNYKSALIDIDSTIQSLEMYRPALQGITMHPSLPALDRISDLLLLLNERVDAFNKALMEYPFPTPEEMLQASDTLKKYQAVISEFTTLAKQCNDFIRSRLDD